MSYATLDDLIDRAGEAELRQIADRDRDGMIDADVVASALADAKDLIDGYVGAKYALPLPSVPSNVRAWAVSISRYTLHRNGAPDHVVKDYDHAVAALKDVVRGMIVLPVPTGETPAAVTGGTAMAAHPEPVFTPSRLAGWR